MRDFQGFGIESLEATTSVIGEFKIGDKFRMSEGTFARFYADANALTSSTVFSQLKAGDQVELQFVKNTSGATIARGMAVIESATTAFNIELPSAATTDQYGVLGVAVTAIPNGSYGWVVTKGVTYMITDGTGALAVGALVSTSGTTAGNVVATTAKTGITLGRVRVAVAATAGLFPVVGFKL